MVYTYILDCYSTIKKTVILPFVMIKIGVEGIMLSEISQREKDKCHVNSLICGIKKNSNSPGWCDSVD